MKDETSDFYNQSIRDEDETTKNTLGELETEFKFYERFFNLASKTISYLFDLLESTDLSHGKFSVMCMLPRLVSTIQSMRLLTLRGYYYDVEILGRTLLENLGLCVYLVKNEDEARNWMTGRKINTASIRLVDEFFSLGSPEWKEGKALYGKLCNYVHANVRAIAPAFLTPIESKKRASVDVSFPPFYDKEKAEDFGVYPIMLLITIIEVFKSELGDKTKAEILNGMSEYLEAHRESD